MKKILILEDDPRTSKALATRLTGAGYEVMTAPDPAFGILLATTKTPDLIISDIWMPVMQGFTFIRQLTSFGLPMIPVIFMTASRREDLYQSAMNLGAAAFLEKPCETKSLLQIVQKVIGPSQLERLTV